MDFTKILNQLDELEIKCDDLCKNNRKFYYSIDRNFSQTIVAVDYLWNKVSYNTQNIEGGLLLLKKSGIDFCEIGKCLSESTFDIEKVNVDCVNDKINNALENYILSELKQESNIVEHVVNNAVLKSNYQQLNKEKEELLSTFMEEVYDDMINNSINNVNSCIKNSNQHFYPKIISHSNVCSLDDFYFSCLTLCHEMILKYDCKINFIEQYFKFVFEYSQSEFTKDIWKMMMLIDECAQTCEAPPIKPGVIYLEQQYMEFIQKTINRRTQCDFQNEPRHPIELFILKTFSQEKRKSYFQIDGIPVWPFVYYCFRSGSLSSSYEFIMKNYIGFCNKDVQHYVSLLMEYREQFTISIEKQNELMTHYKPNDNVYQQILFSILTKTNVYHEFSFINSTEDYLWLKLHLAKFIKTDLTQFEHNFVNSKRKFNEDIVEYFKQNDVLNFDLLQYLVLYIYNEKYFKKNIECRFAYLLLTCQYEHAIVYLYGHSAYRAHSVHLALTMYKQGLIKSIQMTQNPVQECKISSMISISINIASLFDQYIHDSNLLNKTNPANKTNVFNILLLFYHIQDTSYPLSYLSAFYEIIKKCLLEYSQFDEIFGKYKINIQQLQERIKFYNKNNSCLIFSESEMSSCSMFPILLEYGDDIEYLPTYFDKLKSVIYKDGVLYDILRPQDDLFKDIVRYVANEARTIGSVDMSIELNMIYGDFETVLTLFNMELKTHYGLDIHSEKRKNCLKFANYITQFLFCYQIDNEFLVKSFLVLKKCFLIHEAYSNKEYCKAMKLIQLLDIIPFNSNQVESKSLELKHYDLNVKIIITDIIKIILNISEIELKHIQEIHDNGFVNNNQHVNNETVSSDTSNFFCNSLITSSPNESQSKTEFVSNLHNFSDDTFDDVGRNFNNFTHLYNLKTRIDSLLQFIMFEENLFFCYNEIFFEKILKFQTLVKSFMNFQKIK